MMQGLLNPEEKDAYPLTNFPSPRPSHRNHAVPPARCRSSSFCLEVLSVPLPCWLDWPCLLPTLLCPHNPPTIQTRLNLDVHCKRMCKSCWKWGVVFWTNNPNVEEPIWVSRQPLRSVWKRRRTSVHNVEPFTDKWRHVARTIACLNVSMVQVKNARPASASTAVLSFCKIWRFPVRWYPTTSIRATTAPVI